MTSNNFLMESFRFLPESWFHKATQRAIAAVLCASLATTQSGLAHSSAFLIAAGESSAGQETAAGDGEAAVIENEMIAILQSDAASGEKAIACKRLAIYGSGKSVAHIVPLLSDPQLSSWARIALEVIPGNEADEALRTAAQGLQGRILIGVLNSIGVRRDAGAVDVLVTHLRGQDSDAASAAAIALGKIGNDSARTALLEALIDPADAASTSAVAEGCILAAEQLLADNRVEDAATTYNLVVNSQAPKQRILEATRGAILARGDAGIPLLIEKLRSDDKAIFQIALSTAREVKGNQVDVALAGELSGADPERAALIVYAMADRRDTVSLETMLETAKSGAPPVRLAAVQALRKIGNETCVPTLIELAQDSDGELAVAARTALAELPGKEVDGQIASLLSKASGPRFVLLIQLVGERRIDAVSTLIKALENPDASVRKAAVVALGETVPLDKLSVLIQQATSAKNDADSDTAFTALKTASVRMGDREACAGQLSAALDRTASVPAKCSLLEVLAAVGGTKSLEAMNKAARTNTPELQDTSSRLLGEWMTEDAAPVLLDLSKSAPGEKYKVRALRGYIRIARQFVLPEDQRASMCQLAFDNARQTAEKKLVIDILKRYPNVESLKLAVRALQSADVKSEATEATLVIAQKIGSGNPAVQDLLKNAGLEKSKVEIIKAEYGAEGSMKDVTEILQKAAKDLPLVVLEPENYNAAFGGDPAPGTPKQLKIQYRLNGKEGNVSLAENAIVILPIPK
ncbi:MAG: HEAT repeat domain-containing protein [Planctomyces sp.]|nr:HEAT repeat domain-containing protein [Planctomyces sp.]